MNIFQKNKKLFNSEFENKFVKNDKEFNDSIKKFFEETYKKKLIIILYIMNIVNINQIILMVCITYLNLLIMK